MLVTASAGARSTDARSTVARPPWEDWPPAHHCRVLARWGESCGAPLRRSSDRHRARRASVSSRWTGGGRACPGAGCCARTTGVARSPVAASPAGVETARTRCRPATPFVATARATSRPATPFVARRRRAAPQRSPAARNRPLAIRRFRSARRSRPAARVVFQARARYRRRLPRALVRPERVRSRGVPSCPVVGEQQTP